MTDYRRSPLANEAPGEAEVITRWGGHTMGGRRIPAFLGLAQRTGGVFFENPPSVEDALKQTGLDFQVTLEPLQTTVINDDGVSTLDLPRHFATVGRYSDGRTVPFGPVGNKYRPIQNETVAGLGQLVVDRGEGSLLAVGAYGDPIGSKVYMAFDLADFTVGGSDQHNLALNLITTHDGSGGLMAQAAPTRVPCTNQINGIFGKRHASRFTIRHTESAEGRAQEVREALGLAWKYVDRYQEESERLLAEVFTERDFLAFEHELFQVPEFENTTARQRTLIGNRDEILLDLWRGDTNEFGRGTRYAAAQSVYEYLDHLAIVRGSDPDAARWERILTGQTEGAKARVWQALVDA